LCLELILSLAEALGVTKDSTKIEIKKAYHKVRSSTLSPPSVFAPA
jgi:hypothetical protein